MGRPSLKTPELVSAICERLAQGEPLAAICRDEGMPHPSTVRDWMKADAEVSRAIACAREDGEDWLAAECLSIADDGSRDYETKEDGREVVDHDHIQRSKLRIDTRLKLLAKWNPKKYGERLALAGDPDAPVVVEATVTLDPSDAYLRMLNGGV